MSSTGKKWLVGCGIGCGLILLILGGLGAVSFFVVKDVVHEAKNIDTGQAVVDSVFGEPTDFTPRADGRIPPEQVENFLAIRQTLAPVREHTSELILTMEGRGHAGVLGKIKAGIKFVPAILEFINTRNRAMVEEGMGLGEYQYIYALAYYGMLGKDTADGPRFSLVDDDHGHKGFRVKSSFSKGDTLAVRRKRSRIIRAFINQNQGEILANQLAALDSDTGLVAMMPGWRDSLAAEVRAMRDDSRRLPWQDGLPDRILHGLAPFTDRLDALYDPLTSGLEMGLSEKD